MGCSHVTMCSHRLEVEKVVVEERLLKEQEEVRFTRRALTGTDTFAVSCSILSR